MVNEQDYATNGLTVNWANADQCRPVDTNPLLTARQLSTHSGIFVIKSNYTFVAS